MTENLIIYGTIFFLHTESFAMAGYKDFLVVLVLFCLVSQGSTMSLARKDAREMFAAEKMSRAVDKRKIHKQVESFANGLFQSSQAMQYLVD